MTGISSQCRGATMPVRAFVFDAYGTLLDVHAAVSRYRDAAGPDADRFSEIWRLKQLEYAWMLSAAGRYLDFWTLTERALDHAFAPSPPLARPLPDRRPRAACASARCLLQARRVSGRARSAERAQGEGAKHGDPVER